MNKVGFVGAGQMARALASGFVKAARISAANTFACDPSADACRAFVATVDGMPEKQVGDSVDVVQGCDVIFSGRQAAAHDVCFSANEKL